MQSAGLLTDMDMTAYASLRAEKAGGHDKVKAPILRKHEMNEETHTRQFWKDERNEQEMHHQFLN